MFEFGMWIDIPVKYLMNYQWAMIKNIENRTTEKPYYWTLMSRILMCIRHDFLFNYNGQDNWMDIFNYDVPFGM